MAHWTVESPGGATSIEVRFDSRGELSYEVTAFGRAVVDRSALGITRTDADLSAGLEFVARSNVETVDADYEVVHGKRRHGTLRASQQTLKFRNADGHLLEIVLVAADDGVAFRYRFPEERASQVTVIAEATSFTLPEGRAWVQPTQPAGLVAPAYENPYSNGVPTGTATTAPVPSWNFPALFQAGEVWVLLAESDLDAGYFGGHLSNRGTGRTYRIVLPQHAEGASVGATEPSHSLPWTMPWRIIMVGESAPAVAESDLVAALARPPDGDFSWVRPGRVSWSWWSDHDSPQDLARLRRYVDLAADFGWEYTLVDANWNVHTDDEMAALVEYARERGVGVFVWYNSGGPNNAVTEQPRDRMYEPAVRAAEMDKLVRWGVAGVKVDFFHSDKQHGIRLYLDITRDAAQRGLMVNFHGSTVPRGWSRTWPNIMTMEGVRGAEQYSFDGDYPDLAAWHNTVLAFTRNVVGPMDYTPVTFSDERFAHQTTNAHELALSMVFESGLQHFADAAESYRGQSAEVREFLSSVPAVWDDTRVLAGSPGEYVVVARRRGADWYVAAINGSDAPRQVELPLDDLGEFAEALVLTDGSNRDEIHARRGSPKPMGPITMAPRGGFAIRLSG